MKQTFRLTVLPENKILLAEENTDLLTCLQAAALAPDAPCGGNGACGKCRVLVDGKPQLACRTVIHRDMTVELPGKTNAKILTHGLETQTSVDADVTGNLIAIDLGTTTLACCLLDQSGRELAVTSALNPQRSYGADVISRIQTALAGKQQALCRCIRECVTGLIREACSQAAVSPETVQRIALVGNPCMQQLFLGISTENLAKVPFAPVLTELKTLPGYLPICPNGELLVIPDISGYVGADTLACVLATMMYQSAHMTLLVDIGTNGEMVMGNRDRLIACSTAAGPALEGANIRFGMRGAEGAIDRVTWEAGKPNIHVIGEIETVGICGSGLIDAVAGMLKNGTINRRGRIGSAQTELDGERVVFLTEEIYLTQSDIRQVQLAKGAIAAGIELMAKELGIRLEDVEEVLLAGAFGSFIDPASACAIGLLPPCLESKIRAVGNAAGTGARLLACSRAQQTLAGTLCRRIEFLELASLPEFRRTFGQQTHFPGEER